MLRQLAILFLLAHCACAARPVPAPAGEDAALAIIASTYEAQGLPLSLELVSVTWWSADDDCLASFKIDTEHWALKRTCLHGFSLCWINLIEPHGDRPLSRSALAHEVLHCAQYQHEIVDLEHARPEWAWVPIARQRVAEAGL